MKDVKINQQKREISDGTCNCIVCDKKLKTWEYSEDETNVQPMGGLGFFTYGHYGSAFFDPMDGSKIAIVVCDECICKANDKGYLRGAVERNYN